MLHPVEFYFARLPQDVAIKAHEYRRLELESNSQPVLEANSAHEALGVAFDWAKTYEGRDWWTRIHDSLKADADRPTKADKHADLVKKIDSLEAAINRLEQVMLRGPSQQPSGVHAPPVHHSHDVLLCAAPELYKHLPEDIRSKALANYNASPSQLQSILCGRLSQSISVFPWHKAPEGSDYWADTVLKLTAAENALGIYNYAAVVAKAFPSDETTP